jgi:hypothetical protein
MRSNFNLIAGMPVVLILLAGCAKVGAPTGGIKDTTPPKYVDGEPENRSTGFTGNDISFRFDEYIQFKDLNRELMVSPPMKVKPEVRLRDKTVKIQLKDKLLPETTYTINFGNAISDLNEGNLLPDFEFVFSTGKQIDSLSVAGRALSAFDHKPLKDEEVTLMLYDNLSDSAPLKQIPRYIGRANKDGLFTINNIHPDTFRIIALGDANANLKYDPGSEWIAFLDTFLIINAQTVKPITFIKDTIKTAKIDKKEERSGKKVSVKSLIDTTVVQGKKLNALNISLYYFMEQSNKVFLTEKKRESPEKLFFLFSRTPYDSVVVRPLNCKPRSDWYIKESGVRGDSLTYWLTDSMMIKKDTLQMGVTFTTTDSSGRFIQRIDTIRMRSQKTAGKATSGRKSRNTEAKVAVHKMQLTADMTRQDKQNLNRPLSFTMEKPLALIHPENIEFFSIADSISTKQAFTCSKSISNLHKFYISTKWDENMKYRILLKPDAVEDIYHQQNDSLLIKFSTQKEDFYGRILVSAQAKRFPVILQVMDDKGKLVASKILRTSEKVTFDYLLPQKYTLKAIMDRNENGQWDTGNYLKHIQPEEVFYYTLPIELRSNWDQEVTWIIPD